MITNVSLVNCFCLDQEATRDFYVNNLGFETRTDVTMGEMRWVTIGHPSQPELEVTLMVPGPPLDPGQLAWLDAGLAALRDTGLTERDKMAAVMAVLHYVRGAAALSIEAAVEGPDYPALLRRLLDGDRFPALAAALEAGVFDDAAHDPLTEFRSGLGQLLDGIAARMT